MATIPNHHEHPRDGDKFVRNYHFIPPLQCRVRIDQRRALISTVLRCARFLQLYFGFLKVHFFHLSLVFHFLRAELLMRLNSFSRILLMEAMATMMTTITKSSQGDDKGT